MIVQREVAGWHRVPRQAGNDGNEAKIGGCAGSDCGPVWLLDLRCFCLLSCRLPCLSRRGRYAPSWFEGTICATCLSLLHRCRTHPCAMESSFLTSEAPTTTIQLQHLPCTTMFWFYSHKLPCLGAVVSCCHCAKVDRNCGQTTTILSGQMVNHKINCARIWSRPPW